MIRDKNLSFFVFPFCFSTISRRFLATRFELYLLVLYSKDVYFDRFLLAFVFQKYRFLQTPMKGFGTCRRLGFDICVERFAEASCDDTLRFQSSLSPEKNENSA